LENISEPKIAIIELNKNLSRAKSMAVSLKASRQGLERVDQFRKMKGWTKTEPDWSHTAETSLATLKRFWRGHPIAQENFINICQAVGIDNWDEIIDNWEEIVEKSPLPQTNSRPELFSYDSCWVGREPLIAELSEKLRGSCRLLLILGLTGIGKTALAEKLIVQLQDWFAGDWKNKLRRVNFDYEDKATDFTSVAVRWLEEWGDKLSADDTKPERLLQRLVKHLRENQVIVLIDSLERLLTGNEEDGRGDFADEWWEKFFLSLLAAESCQSRLIITAQDLPVKLVDYRYKNFWHRQVLHGLNELEQEALFKTRGLAICNDSPDRSLLLRIGNAYSGHPLALRVIIGEICSEPFNGNVQAYWGDYGNNIEEVENTLAEAETGIRKISGVDNNWQLHRFTTKVRLQVNQQRLKSTFDRLEKQVKDAYILICAASVYRTPVRKEGWLIQLVNLVKYLEHQECSEERQEKALEELRNRYLVEESINHNNKRIVRLHNLVRSVALARHKELLQSLKHDASSA
jgi:hypothetical protein